MLFALCISPLIGIFAVRSLHKLLQLLLKALIAGRRCKLAEFNGSFFLLSRRRRGRSRFRLFFFRLNCLDGKVDFALFVDSETGVLMKLSGTSNGETVKYIEVTECDYDITDITSSFIK